MKIINASAEVIAFTPDLEKVIELAGRTCYQSADKTTEDSAPVLIGRLMESKHESVLEHGSITVRFIVDRGVSHELVRHRIASFSQESTRYVGYHKAKFEGQIVVIDPLPAFPNMSDLAYACWKHSCEIAESSYLSMIHEGGSAPQEARSVLPNSLKTEIIVTANPREWLHIFKLRCAREAHPQMREVMIPLRDGFAKKWPSIFGGRDA